MAETRRLELGGPSLWVVGAFRPNPFEQIILEASGLYVSDFYTGDLAVKRFQGPAWSNPGAFMDTFVPAGSGGLRAPSALVFGLDANDHGQLDLYLADVDVDDFDKASVLRYDGVSGDFIDTFVHQDSGGLVGAVMIAFTDTDPVTLAYNGDSPAPPPMPPPHGADAGDIDPLHPTQTMMHRGARSFRIDSQMTDSHDAHVGTTPDPVTPRKTRILCNSEGGAAWLFTIEKARPSWFPFVQGWARE